ncbi:MAG: hypothetical protein JSR45_09225 [Proteobacteria bacterium]|nr:hypothetical protein [Pseudomonadota bacterium]
MILPLLLAAVTASAPAPAPAAGPAALPAPRTLPEPAISPKAESGCGYLALKVTKPAEPAKGKEPAKPAEATPEYKILAGFKVMGGPFQLTAPKTEETVWAYRCTRDTIVPAKFDGRVLLFLGKPLVITDGARSGVLQMQKGAFSFNVTKGEVTAEEKDSIQKQINIFTVNYQTSVALAKQQGAASAAAAPAAADTPVKTKR